jgi:tripartite-type tricarboxylate transporter receptor subunit TctC
MLGMVVVAAIGAASNLPVDVNAQPYPSRPIRMVQPFSPGGTSDTLARILGQRITERWGQPVVIDVRPGASGTIGTEIAARAPADGYTLLYGNSTQFVVSPFLYSRLGYDTLRDFLPLSLTGTAPQLVVVHPGVQARTMQDIVLLAKARPGALNFGSGGAGTLAYIGGEMFKAATGVHMVHVPYKGTVLALNELLGGQIQILFSDMPVALPHAKSGKLRALAVTSAERTPLVPGVATVAESGVPGYALVNWWGVLAPRGIPADVAARWHAELVRIHALPELKERYAGLGIDAATSTPDAFAAYIKKEASAFANIIRASGAKLD